MSTLIQAINQEQTVTENGMPTYTSSLNSVTDLFFKIGASRGKNIIGDFSKAFAENADLAVRVALWSRDVRGGAGERQLFRDILTYLVDKDYELTKKIIAKVPELGRWDDLLVLFGTKAERDVLRMITKALKDDHDGLCAKWMPRKGDQANKLRAYLQISPKQYRKMLVELTNVVETAMCSNEWSTIDFSKLPSVASARYQKAFGKHAPEQYVAYLASLQKGETKINAGAVYPYDILTSLQYGNAGIANEQWKALPNYLEGSKENILPLVDVSGSMGVGVGGGTGTVTCMNVAVSLGLYLSERSEGIFKDTFITFSERPELCTVKGSLSDRMQQMMSSSWSMNTNLEAAFRLILNAAVKHKVPVEQMPTQLLILSDMQFDSACRNPSNKAIEMIDQMYAEAGYKRPNVVFWNLRDSNGVPVTFDKMGTALVSGFSPSIMKAILAADQSKMSPVGIMLAAVGIDRYTV